MANRYDGRSHRGAARVQRRLKHDEAVARNAETLPERRKAARKGKA